MIVCSSDIAGPPLRTYGVRHPPITPSGQLTYRCRARDRHPVRGQGRGSACSPTLASSRQPRVSIRRTCGEVKMRVVSRGFQGRRRQPGAGLVPPGQYVVDDFPVLTAGPTPSIDVADWDFTVVDQTGGAVGRWTWDQFLALPAEDITVDIHCVTKWSKLGTTWRGVSVDTLLDGIETSAEFVVAFSEGGYTTNLPLQDVVDGQAWVAFKFDGEDLEAEHGGPAR